MRGSRRFRGKVTVQGLEDKLLEGMQETIRRSEEMIMLMEFWPFGLESAGRLDSGPRYANIVAVRGNALPAALVPHA